MNASLGKKMLAGFDPTGPIESAWMPPASWYIASDFYSLELDRVFRCGYQPLARLEQVAEPGSYVAGCSFGEPWVIVRGEDAKLRAFANTCRHKGREVAQGSGSALDLTCGYHGWVYDLRGRLRSAPKIAGIRDFDRDAMSLPELPLVEWGHWAFVCLGGKALGGAPEAPKTAFPELDVRLRASNWSGLRFAGEKRWVIDCNWKVYVDNYLDGGYHIPSQHPSLDAQIDMDQYRTELFEHCSIQSAPPRQEAGTELDYDAEQRIGEQAIYAWLFPNFMINRYGPCLDTNYVVPLSPERCEVVYEFYFAPELSRDHQGFTAASIAQADVTQQEDIAICESVQRGLSSSHYDRGRYAPRVEMGEYHFHQLLHRLLSER